MKIRVWRVCRLCGVSFEGTYKSRYCSNAHRQAAYRNRRDEIPETAGNSARDYLKTLFEVEQEH